MTNLMFMGFSDYGSYRSTVRLPIAGDNGEEVGIRWGLGAAIAHVEVEKSVRLGLGFWVKNKGVLGSAGAPPNLQEICDR